MKSNGTRGFGLPPPAKFRSGHIPNGVDDSGTNSDNDASDSEEEVYSGRYSLDSSPQDYRVPNGNGAAHRYRNLAQRSSQYGSEYNFSEVSSSKETVVGRPGGLRNPQMGKTRKAMQSNFTEDESSDSAASSEFSTTPVISISGTAQKKKNYLSEWYTSSVPSRMNVNHASEKVCSNKLVL